MIQSIRSSLPDRQFNAGDAPGLRESIFDLSIFSPQVAAGAT